MKALSLESQLTSVSTRSDGSLALRFATPELDPVAKTAIFEIQGKNIKLLMQPMDGTPDELIDVKKEFQTNTPSMRLRACLYVSWEQSNKPGEFDDYYRHRMEYFINEVKQNLQPV